MNCLYCDKETKNEYTYRWRTKSKDNKRLIKKSIMPICNDCIEIILKTFCKYDYEPKFTCAYTRFFKEMRCCSKCYYINKEYFRKVVKLDKVR